MTKLEDSTLALSAHNAIVAMDRPATSDDIAAFLNVYFQPTDAADVDRALMHLLARGHVKFDGTLCDTALRDKHGDRRMIKDRPRAGDGWF